MSISICMCICICICNRIELYVDQLSDYKTRLLSKLTICNYYRRVQWVADERAGQTGGVAHDELVQRQPRGQARALALIGWHYSSNATCLIRPPLSNTAN